jgi:hypothetical protein
MNSKKLVPMLLAASVLVTGFSGAFVYAPNAAFGITSVDELSDIDRSSWAFDALRDLVEKYNVIEGYPDKTFRGDHKATRYEMAAALNALIRHIGKDIARLGTEKADKEDLAKLARLQEEFKTELAALQARTDALEARAAKIEAKNEEQDNRLTVLEKLKIYGDVTLGGFADIGSRGGNGQPFVGQGFNTFVPNGAYGLAAADPYGVPFLPFANTVNQTASEGFSDSISALGRVRVNIDYPIVEDLDGEGVIGEGTIHTRIVGAYGRVSPLLSNSDLANGFGATKITNGQGMLSGVSRIASDASAFNEGIRASSLSNNVVTGSNTRANLYVESAYYTQEFRSGIPLLTDLLPGIDLLPDDENWKLSMKMKAGLIPWREIFQQSPYTGDETQQFQNTAMLNNASIAVNAVAPTVAFEWHQGLGEWHSLDAKTAISALDVSDAAGALALTYEGSLNYNFGWVSDWLDHPGNLYAGGWLVHGRGGSNSLITTATGYNGTQFGSIEDMARGLSQDTLGTIARSNMLAVGNTGALTVANLEGGMGLPAGSLTTNATLAASLGITTAQLGNVNTTLPAATIAAINASPTWIGGALPANATLGEYYRELQNNTTLPIAAGNLLPSGSGNRTGTIDDNDNANGFYAGWNQELHRGAGLFFSYGVADTGPQSVLTSALMNGTGRNSMFNRGILGIHGVKQAYNMGVEIPMDALHLPWRKKDVLGVGYAQVDPNDAFGGSYAGSRAFGKWGRVSAGSHQSVFLPGAGIDRDLAARAYNKGYAEHILEAYYKVHVNDRFSITPNVQFIINRLGDPSNDLMTVIGLRSTFNF